MNTKNKELYTILNIVQDITGQKIINNKSRDVYVVDAKKYYYHIARKLTRFSLSEIGQVLSVHHATVIHHLKKTENYLATDLRFKKKYLECLREASYNVENHLLNEYKYHLAQARNYILNINKLKQLLTKQKQL